MAYIDSDKLMAEIKNLSSNGAPVCFVTVRQLEKMIAYLEEAFPVKDTPAADVVEVVRCKDCKAYEPHGNGKRGICRNPKCKGLHWANDFCSYGERRE